MHHEHLPVDRLGGRAGQVGDQRRDVFRGHRVRLTRNRRLAHQRGCHRGPAARADRVGPYPVPGAAARGGQGERGDAGLGRGVVGLARRAEQERLGGRVHDPGVDRAGRLLAGGAPVRGGEPGGHEVAAQVHPDDLVPLLLGHGEDHPVPDQPGVVDQDVQPAVRAQRGGHQVLPGLPVADVAGAGYRLPAARPDLLGRRAHLRGGQVVEHQAGAGLGQPAGLGPAEPISRAGDDGHPAVQRQRLVHRGLLLSSPVRTGSRRRR